MTNGIAVGLRDRTRDYWHNGTCCSGYSYALDGDVLGHMIRNYLERKSLWDKLCFREYAPHQKLVVPEKLVWWKDE